MLALGERSIDWVSKITAHGANYDMSELGDYAALNVLRMMNRSLLAVKASNDSTGTVKGPTMMTYSHIGD